MPFTLPTIPSALCQLFSVTLSDLPEPLAAVAQIMESWQHIENSTRYNSLLEFQENPPLSPFIFSLSTWLSLHHAGRHATTAGFLYVIMISVVGVIYKDKLQTLLGCLM